MPVCLVPVLLQSDRMDGMMLGVVIAGIVLVFALIVWMLRRYRRVPPNVALVITGAGIPDGKPTIVTGAGIFLWPLQTARELHLDSLSVRLEDDDGVTVGDWRILAPGAVTVGISLDPDVLQTAANELLGTDRDDRAKLARETVFQTLRNAVPPPGAGRRRDEAPDGATILARFRDDLPRALATHGLELVTFNIQQVEVASRLERVDDDEGPGATDG